MDTNQFFKDLNVKIAFAKTKKALLYLKRRNNSFMRDAKNLSRDAKSEIKKYYTITNKLITTKLENI